jgi:hypothetical protein
VMESVVVFTTIMMVVMTIFIMVVTTKGAL